ncbi:methyltransferase family protein [Desulfosarcina variabilis]|uniref:methyltransferase family protein n=1 Tax=Desulfosarcina variabilis TaxID=2300 RepID=UPI003AFB4DED
MQAVRLDLFTLLTPKPLTADAVAETIDADLRGITILLDALCALGFIKQRHVFSG